MGFLNRVSNTPDIKFKTYNRNRLSGKTSATILLLGLVVIAVAAATDYALLSLNKRPKTVAIPAVLPQIPELQELRDYVKQSPERADFHIALGKAFFRYQHFMSAREEYTQALAHKGDEWTCLMGRAQANVQLNRFDLASKDMERLIQLRPQVFETYLSLAEIKQRADDWPAAVKVLDSVPRRPDGTLNVSGFKDDLIPVEFMATAYSHLDRWDKTEALVRLSLSRDSQRQSARIMLGKVLHATNRKPESIPYLEEGVKAAPKNAEIAYILGTAYQARKGPGDSDRAAACFEHAVQADDRHGAATLAMAYECEKRKLWTAAAFAFNRAHQLGMEDETMLLHSGDAMLKAGSIEEGHYRRGLYFEQIRRHDLALKEYEVLVNMHDSCRSGYIHMSRAYSGMHNAEMTLKCLKLAQQSDPKTASLLDWNIVDALGSTKYAVERIELLKSLAKKPGAEGNEAVFQLFRLADASGKHAEAEKYIRQCVAFDPKDSVFHYELGRFLLQERGDPAKLKEAVSELETSVRQKSDDRNAVYGLGLAYSYAGNTENAVLALRHTIDLQPENGDGYQPLMQALLRAGLKTEAADIASVFKKYESFAKTRETLQARCKREPTNPDAQFTLAEFHMASHEYPAAIERFSKVLALKPDNRKARIRLAEACGYMGRREEQRAHLAMLDKRMDKTQ